MSFCSNLTDITISSLLHCRNHKFKQLHLRGLSNTINTHLITEPFEQISMEMLKELTLTDCTSVTNDTLCSISTTCQLLEKVRLDWCVSITDEGIVMLISQCTKLQKLVLVGLKRLLGAWLPGLNLQHLTLLDVTQCDLIADDELQCLVKRFPCLTAYNYYHEQVIAVSDETASSTSEHSQVHFTNTSEAPCPASRGAFVDF